MNRDIDELYNNYFHKYGHEYRNRHQYGIDDDYNIHDDRFDSDEEDHEPIIEAEIVLDDNNNQDEGYYSDG